MVRTSLIYLFLVYLSTLDHVTSNALTIVSNWLEWILWRIWVSATVNNLWAPNLTLEFIWIFTVIITVNHFTNVKLHFRLSWNSSARRHLHCPSSRYLSINCFGLICSPPSSSLLLQLNWRTTLKTIEFLRCHVKSYNWLPKNRLAVVMQNLTICYLGIG
jgi:hypothetical protein